MLMTVGPTETLAVSQFEFLLIPLFRHLSSHTNY